MSLRDCADMERRPLRALMRPLVWTIGVSIVLVVAAGLLVLLP